ncbi:MAG TPA: adenylate/guanylate cyclase domain-containing protein [Anaerolineae bacterium]|nr:adenylate/guanylate cyclase domain-containing protein [Anaerolineae bacterium]
MNLANLEKELTRFRQQYPDDEPATAAFEDWLRNGSSLYRRLLINPYYIADYTNHPLHDVLTTMLHMTTTGLLNLHWAVHCPHCNMTVHKESFLSNLSQHADCGMCDITFEVDFHNQVEVSFTLNKTIEFYDVGPPCNPLANLDPKWPFLIKQNNASTHVETLEAGTYRYFCPLTNSRGVMYIDGEPTTEEQSVTIEQKSPKYFDPAEIHLRPGPIRLTLINNVYPLSGFTVYKNHLPLLPREHIPPRITGLEIIHHPVYRHLFGDQALSSDEQLSIEAVTIMFTDIMGSTTLYETVGDARAYNLVREHFDLLFNTIEAHGGTIIKTIGDAVMASFLTNEQGFNCAHDILATFAQHNQGHEDDELIIVKIGLHRGQAIVVNLNNRLDYFGRSVNKAAHIQAQANGDQVAYSLPIHQDPDVAALYEKYNLTPHSHRIRLKGHHRPETIYTISLSNP